MKKFLVAVSVFLGIVAMTDVAGAIEVQMESLTWFDYGFKLDDAFAITSGGQFSVGRQYLTLKANYDNLIKARVTLDLVNSVTNAGAFDKFVKYAYVDFKLADAFVVTAGLQKVYFGYIPEWEYPLPVKELCESKKIESSADLGIGFSGTLLNKLLTYHVQLLNGEGYATWYPKTDTCFQTLADIRLNYMKDSFFGLSYTYYDNGENTSAKLNHAVSVYNITKIDPLSVLVEYCGSLTNGGAMTSSIQAFVAVKVSDMFSPMAYFNMTFGGDPVLGIGANILPLKKIIVKPYFGITLGDTLSYEFKTQMEVKFDLKVGTPDAVAAAPAPAPVTSTVTTEPAPEPAPVTNM